ncbi:MAG: AI-2E family transporter [Acidobacteria bacterium]|nr:MAG: AI-2E family transporter [Acidobacteriota bacterium]
MNEDRFRKLFLLLVVAGISALFLAMVRGFVMTLLLAAILSGLMYPVYRRITLAVRGRRALASLLTLLLMMVGVFGPLAALAGVVAQQAIGLMAEVGPALKPFIDDPDRIRRELALIPGLSRVEPFMPQIAERSAEIVSGVGSFLVNRVSAATSGTVVFLFEFAVLLYAMFFFFLHGHSWLRIILSYLPFSEEDGQRLLERFVSVTRATLKGTLLIGAIQGTINGIAFWVIGRPAPAFWGAVMIILSVVPAIGGALVWVPAAIWLGLTGRLGQAIVLLVLCGAVSGSVDNVLRPRLVGRDTKMPDLLILISTLGGLGFFGAVGFIVGPLVTALFLTLWQILGELYRPSPLVKS